MDRERKLSLHTDVAVYLEKLGLSKSVGPASDMKKQKTKTHFELVRSKSTLWRAWQSVRSNGIASDSRTTRKEIRTFDDVAITEINRISGSLSNKKSFSFDAATGVPQPKTKGGIRPIVISSVRNRVVQRAILDVLQDDAKLQDLFDSATSFGGLKEKGVRDAVLRAHKDVISGRAKFVITSDISGFFQDIKRSSVEAAVAERIEDRKFQDLFKGAIKTELRNLNTLRSTGKDHYFPIQELGVAQGCSLSPLVGNIYLGGFDAQMNSTDSLCLRYIDDFIILGTNESETMSMFNIGLKILKELGLSAYMPGKNSDKASAGPTSKSFDYLGCTIHGKLVRPSNKS